MDYLNNLNYLFIMNQPAPVYTMFTLDFAVRPLNHHCMADFVCVENK